MRRSEKGYLPFSKAATGIFLLSRPMWNRLGRASGFPCPHAQIAPCGRASAAASVVPPGWLRDDAFLAGYGAAQAVPGPLFTFSAYLGPAMSPPPNGWVGAIICLVAVFLPSFLLVFGARAFGQACASRTRSRRRATDRLTAR